MRKAVKRKTNIKIGGVVVNATLVDRVVEVLQEADRMPKNPDNSFLRETVEKQLTEEGLVRLIVFICPKFNTPALFGNSTDGYMPVESLKNDLFEPRIPKIIELRAALFKLGVVSTLEFVVGDNDFETCRLPFFPDLKWDPKKVAVRRQRYVESFELRVREEFGVLVNVWSLADLGITLSTNSPKVSEDQFERELKFFSWLFSQKGPYESRVFFGDTQLREMAELKFRAYGAQGEFLEDLLQGILLQTEGPGVWLQRTQMFRCTGAESAPAIYPWIRREEVREMKE
jgi:hypothetical protein